MMSMTGKWSRNLPDMMRLMYALIYKSVMKASVNPVDQHVGEKEEGQDTNDELKPAVGKAPYVII